MEKTRILFVTGDDYAASVVKDEIGLEEAVKKAEKGESFDGIDLQLLEFDAVDPKFIDFLYNKMLDYDRLKTTDFFVLGESQE